MLSQAPETPSTAGTAANTNAPSTSAPSPLGLPAPEPDADGPQDLKVGTTVKLDKLGPLVVNTDGVRAGI
ncbi:hypothetical protein FRB97_008110 [Tulasnella sp. 331]|nr:hypothetical protein FRB97_008110 [Tulasnella sp. 331]